MKTTINVLLVFIVFIIMNIPFFIFSKIKFVNISNTNSYYVNITDVVILHPISNKNIIGKIYYERLYPTQIKIYYDRLLPSGKEIKILSNVQKLEKMISSLTIFDIIDNVSISTSLENESLIHTRI